MNSGMLWRVAILAVGLCHAEVPSQQIACGRWNLASLDCPPQTFPVTEACSNEYGRLEGIEPIWIAGEPYHGRPTRIFAWWGLPRGASAAHPVPGIVLVHGGGGTAFQRWVETWTRRGWAAIAMDTCGKIPKGERDGKLHRTHAWSGPSGWGSSVAQVDEPLGEQWTYHAIAAIMRCHSFLRGRPEVDAARTAVTGISWGGYLTSIVMCVDPRFKFAAPVYGCGWYDLNPEWMQHMGRDAARYERWLNLWDPKNFLGAGDARGPRCPVLWCAGTNDRWYPLDALKKSYEALGTGVKLNLSLRLRMPHGHGKAGDPPDIAVFASSLLKGGPAPVELAEEHLVGNRLIVKYVLHERTLARTELLYTDSVDPILMKRPWQVAPGPLPDAEGRSVFIVPDSAVMFFANAVSAEGLVTSTRINARVR